MPGLQGFAKGWRRGMEGFELGVSGRRFVWLSNSILWTCLTWGTFDRQSFGTLARNN